MGLPVTVMNYYLSNINLCIEYRARGLEYSMEHILQHYQTPRPETTQSLVELRMKVIRSTIHVVN